LKRKVRTESQLYYFSLKRPHSPGIYIDDGWIVVSVNGRRELICEESLFNLPGKHNVENCLAAVAVACIYGLHREEIAEGLKSFHNLPHRIEKVGTIEGVEFIDDSKSTNVDSSLKALLTVSPPIILILGGRDKGNDYSILRQPIRERVRFVVAVGESRDKIQKALRGVVSVFPQQTLEEATEFAFENATSGDKILLSPGCSSFDMFKNYKERGEVFRRVFKELKANSEAYLYE